MELTDMKLIQILETCTKKNIRTSDQSCLQQNQFDAVSPMSRMSEGSKLLNLL